MRAINILDLFNFLSHVKSLGSTVSKSHQTDATRAHYPRYLGADIDGKNLDFPWGDLSGDAEGENVPDTGVVRKYVWSVERATLAPDGFEQGYLTVNGQFPGPLIEANWGDTVEIIVHNNITGPEEGTAIHWHGIHQRNTGIMDGVSGITQCPIVPGGTFTYRWKASTYGSTWWHGHHALQYGGGLWGPIIIYGPSHVDYDYDLGPVTLTDLYHQPYEHVAMNAIAATNDSAIYVPKSDNQLINGKADFNCSAGAEGYKCTEGAELASLRFESGKTHKIRLINTSVEAMQIFSIDGHKLIVTTMDFVPVEPYEVEFIILGAGMRAEVLVKAIEKPEEAYYMRTRVQCAATKVNETLGHIYYDEAKTDAIPASVTVNALPNFSNTCGDIDLLKKKPYFKKSVPEPDLTLDYSITWHQNASGNHQWLMNNVTFQADWSRPLLLEAIDGNQKYLAEPQHILTEIPDDVRHVRVIVDNHFSIHPMHIHGGDFQILSESDGYWNGTLDYPDNPARADTSLMRRFGHLVIQFDATNPGVWSFHCHVAWHASVGLYINFLVKPKKLKELGVPDDVRETCKTWDDYRNLRGQNALPFDSGL